MQEVDKQEKQAVTLARASQMTGFSEEALYAKVKRKEIPYYKFGKTVMFNLPELNDLLLANRIETAVEKEKRLNDEAERLSGKMTNRRN